MADLKDLTIGQLVTILWGRCKGIEARITGFSPTQRSIVFAEYKAKQEDKKMGIEEGEVVRVCLHARHFKAPNWPSGRG